MRATALLIVLTATAGTVSAQEPAASATGPSTPAAAAARPAQDAASRNLPVSVDRIRKALQERPAQPLLGLREQATFRIEVQQRNRLQDLLDTLDFRTGPPPPGGIYAAEMQRVMFPSVSNPLRQPFAAFNQPELLTILIQTIAGTYLAGKAVDAVTRVERAAAEAAARAELRRAVAGYCTAQPNGGAGIVICGKPPLE
jgi:hypothetical protein